jgi:hypothetical protein
MFDRKLSGKQNIKAEIKANYQTKQVNERLIEKRN